MPDAPSTQVFLAIALRDLEAEERLAAIEEAKAEAEAMAAMPPKWRRTHRLVDQATAAMDHHERTRASLPPN